MVPQIRLPLRRAPVAEQRRRARAMRVRTFFLKTSALFNFSGCTPGGVSRAKDAKKLFIARMSDRAA